MRDAQPSDLASLARLLLLVHQLHVDAHPEVYRPISHDKAGQLLQQRLREPDTIVRVAEADTNLPLGFYCAVIRSLPESMLLHSRKLWYVNEVVVDPASRGQGIGGKLLVDLKQLAEREAVDSLELDVGVFNAEARQFFQGQGFEPVRIRMQAQVARSR